MSYQLYHIMDELYVGQHYLFIGPLAEFQKWAMDTFQQTTDRNLGRAAGFCKDIRVNNLQTFLIWLPKFAPNPHDIAVLTHELGHAAIKKLTSIGADYQITYNNDEHFCYYHSYLTRKFLTEIYKTNNNENFGNVENKDMCDGKE